MPQVIKCARVSLPKPATFYLEAPSTKEPLATFIGMKIGGTERYQGTTGRSTPYVRCSEVGHMSSFESRASNSNGHLRTTVRDQVSTGRVRYSTVPCTESSANKRCHRTRSTGRSGAHRTRAQRGLQNTLTPDAHHRTHPERPVLSVRHPLLKSCHTGCMNRKHPASGVVRPLLNPNRVKH